MRIIVGLGNKGKEYEETRHNAGFMFVDEFVKNKEISDGNVIQFHTENKFQADIAEAHIDGEKIVFAKPNTYMNASGKAVSSILQFYKASPSDLIVAMDDVDIPLGTVRVRDGGSSGGHKGTQNIIDSIKYENFIRVRIGIANKNEKESNFETAQYVLDKFSKRELPVLDKTIMAAVEYVAPFIKSKNKITCHTFEVTGKEQKG